MQAMTWADWRLAGAALAGFLLTLLLIIRFHWQAVLALLTGSLTIGLLTGMPAGEIIRAVHTGVGQSLQEVALLVGIGSMLGAVLDLTGGAQVLAEALLSRAGERRAAAILAVTGLLLSVTIYISTAMLVLMPLVCSLARRSGRPVLYFAVPMLAGVVAGCTMLPPSAAPVLCAAEFGVDPGMMIALSGGCALCGLAVAGLGYGAFCGRRIPLPTPAPAAAEQPTPHHRRPAVGVVLALVLLPLALILLRSAAGALGALPGWAAACLTLCGEPFAALLITVLAAVYLLGYRGGYSWVELEKPMTQSLASAGNILLLMAAGGVLRYMLEYSGLSALLGELLAAVRMPPILAGFLLAGAIRVAIGSSTAAISMTAGILAGLPGALPTPLYAACTAVAVCAGGTLCSHLNDVGFWLAKACLQADEKTTLQVWTVLTGIFGTAAFAAALLISLFA